MAKITLIYPEGGLTVNITVRNRETGVVFSSGVMTEITSGFYNYNFEEERNTDYIYTAITTGYDNIDGCLYSTSKLDQIYDRVDIKVSESYGGGGRFDYVYMDEKLKELKEEIINKNIDFIPIINKIKEITKPINKEEISDIIEKQVKPLLKKMDTVEKYIKDKKQEEKEEKELEKKLKEIKKEFLEEMEKLELTETMKDILEELDLDEIYNLINE